MPALPASTIDAPRYFDRYTDTELRRLFSAWKPDNGPQAIVRELTSGERAELTQRARELHDGLCGYLSHERAEVDASLAAMFGGFRSMRQEGDAAESLMLVTANVLREFPVWAIVKGCMKIAQNQAGLDRRWPPNDAEIYEIVSDVVKEYRRTLANIDALLAAPVDAPRQMIAPAITPPNDVRPLGADPQAPLVEVRPNDGKHAARVAAQLAAKRAEREANPELAALIKAGMA